MQDWEIIWCWFNLQILMCKSKMRASPTLFKHVSTIIQPSQHFKVPIAARCCESWWMATSNPSLGRSRLRGEAPDGSTTTSFGNRPNCAGSVACAMFGAKMKTASNVIWNMKIISENPRLHGKAKRRTSRWVLEMGHLRRASCNIWRRITWIERSFYMKSIEKCIRTIAFRDWCRTLAGAAWALSSMHWAKLVNVKRWKGRKAG